MDIIIEAGLGNFILFKIAQEIVALFWILFEEGKLNI